MNATKTRQIGNGSLELTQLGLGGVFVGGRDQPDGSTAAYDTGIATLTRAYELGVRYFDTAPFYGRGRSEVRVGRALKHYPREEFILSSKVGRLLVPDESEPGRWEDEQLPRLKAKFDLSRDGILRSVDESLRRLDLEYIDILYLHDPDWEDLEAEARDTALPMLFDLKSQGVVKAVGVGMNQWEMPFRFLADFDLDVILLAGRYTLLDQCAYDHFLTRCVERNAKVVTGGPFNSGILAATDLDEQVWFNYQNAPAEWLEKARAIQRISKAHDVEMKAAALQFPLAHPAVASVIPGAASVAQLEENARLMDAKIPASFWAHLKEEKLIPSRAPTPE